MYWLRNAKYKFPSRRWIEIAMHWCILEKTMGMSETQNLRHGNYLEMSAFLTWEIGWTLLINLWCICISDALETVDIACCEATKKRVRQNGVIPVSIWILVSAFSVVLFQSGCFNVCSSLYISIWKSSSSEHQNITARNHKVELHRTGDGANIGPQYKGSEKRSEFPERKEEE